MIRNNVEQEIQLILVQVRNELFEFCIRADLRIDSRRIGDVSPRRR